MPSIKDDSTVEAIARAFTGECKRNEEQAMLTVGYSKTYARGGRGHEMVYANERVRAAIARIDAGQAEKAGYSIEEYRRELQEDRALAIELNQPSAAVSATVAKGRSCGYDKTNEVGGVDKPATLSDAEVEALRADAQRMTQLKVAQ